LRFELFIQDDVSGEQTKIYSVIIENENETLYERFVHENRQQFRKEVENLHVRLQAIGNKYGLMEEYFELGGGAKRSHRICKLKDRPKSLLRLYFIEFGNMAIILGGGGHKPKDKRRHQDVPKLEKENNLLGMISETLQKAMRKGHLTIDEENGTMTSTTDFIYDTNDYE
jgi:hypothetical protein